MKKLINLQNDNKNLLKKSLYFLFVIIAAFLIIRGFKWLISEDYSTVQPAQEVQWLHELESSDSAFITKDDGTPVVLTDNIPKNKRLDFKLKNKIIFSFTRELDILITNNTNDSISLGQTLAGLEIFENNKWTYFPPSRGVGFDAIAVVLHNDAETVIAYPIHHYDLKRGHYRAIISYYYSGQLIINPVEFDVTGIF